MDASSLNDPTKTEVDPCIVNKQNEVIENTSEEEQNDTKGRIKDVGETSPTKLSKQSKKVSPILQTDKRTSKRRPTQANMSIIQNAIAMKEKSFEDYLKPRSKITKLTKIKGNPEDLNEKLPGSASPNFKKTSNQNRNKKLKSSQGDLGDSKTLEIGDALLYENPDEDEQHVRRSQRTLSGDSKKRTSLVDHKSEKEDLLIEPLNFRLCKCTENKGLFMESKSDSHFCTAVDSISDKLMGCTRLVDIKTVPMHRPSTRIPFGVFCEAHLQRLIRHNCCPTCGVFCTQGEFVECPSKHYFHKDCKLLVEDMPCCPHCGDSTPSTAIIISMYSSKEPIFLPVQRSHQ